MKTSPLSWTRSPQRFDQERWRRRLPVIGETVVIGEHRGRVLSRTSREVMSEDGSGQVRAEIEIVIAPEDD